MLRQRFGDLDQLLFAHAELIDRRIRQFMQPDAFHELHRFQAAFLPIDNSVALLFISQENIFHDGKVRDQRQLLMDDDNAFLLTIPDRSKPAFLSFIQNIPRIRTIRINSAQHVHQRRLSCTIFANQRMNRFFLNLDIHLIQSPYTAREFLDDIFHFQQILCHVCSSISVGAGQTEHPAAGPRSYF